MSKQVACPVKEFPGVVIFHDPMTLAMASQYEIAMDYGKRIDNKESALYAVAAIPGCLATVEKWSLKGFQEGITLDSIPLNPPGARAEFVAWLVAEVDKLYRGTEVPNE